MPTKAMFRLIARQCPYIYSSHARDLRRNEPMVVNVQRLICRTERANRKRSWTGSVSVYSNSETETEEQRTKNERRTARIGNSGVRPQAKEKQAAA